MASTLVIEDGSGVEGANSYATVAEARAYAASRGKTFPADDAEADRLMLRAMDAIERHRGDFVGTKTSRDQPLQWPRGSGPGLANEIAQELRFFGSGVVIEGYEYGCDEIPPQLIQAQILLAIEAQSAELVANRTSARLKRMKVEGAVDMEYYDDEVQPLFALADSLLAVLFGDNASGTFGGFTTDRV